MPILRSGRHSAGSRSVATAARNTKPNIGGQPYGVQGVHTVGGYIGSALASIVRRLAGRLSLVRSLLAGGLAIRQWTRSIPGAGSGECAASG